MFDSDSNLFLNTSDHNTYAHKWTKWMALYMLPGLRFKFIAYIQAVFGGWVQVFGFYFWFVNSHISSCTLTTKTHTMTCIAILNILTEISAFYFFFNFNFKCMKMHSFSLNGNILHYVMHPTILKTLWFFFPQSQDSNIIF